MLTHRQSTQEITQELIAAFTEIFMLGRPHHGGNLRHGDAEFLLGEDRQNIVRFQRKGDA